MFWLKIPVLVVANIAQDVFFLIKIKFWVSLKTSSSINLTNIEILWSLVRNTQWYISAAIKEEAVNKTLINRFQ